MRDLWTAAPGQKGCAGPQATLTVSANQSSGCRPVGASVPRRIQILLLGFRTCKKTRKWFRQTQLPDVSEYLVLAYRYSSTDGGLWPSSKGNPKRRTMEAGVYIISNIMSR
jgi:hypothetical protein